MELHKVQHKCSHNINVLRKHVTPKAADFVLLDDSTLLAFESGVTNDTQCVDIFIVNDTILESSEFFNIVLSSSDANVVIENGVTTILIIDDDGMPRYPVIVNELSISTFTVQRSL